MATSYYVSIFDCETDGTQSKPPDLYNPLPEYVYLFREQPAGAAACLKELYATSSHKLIPFFSSLTVHMLNFEENQKYWRPIWSPEFISTLVDIVTDEKYYRSLARHSNPRIEAPVVVCTVVRLMTLRLTPSIH